MNYLYFKVLCYATDEQLKQLSQQGSPLRGLTEEQLLMVLREKRPDNWYIWLEYACENGYDELAKLAIANSNSFDGMIIIMLGFFNKKDLIQMVLDKGYKMTVWDLRGACYGGHLELVRYLYQKIVEIAGGSRSNLAPAEARKGRLWFRHIEYLLQNSRTVEIAKFFVDQEDVVRRFENSVWWNLWEFSASSGNFELTSYFVEHYPYRPIEFLFRACYGGNRDIVDLAIECGSTDWDMGLIGACRTGQLEIAKLMISKGAQDFIGSLDEALESYKKAKEGFFARKYNDKYCKEYINDNVDDYRKLVEYFKGLVSAREGLPV